MKLVGASSIVVKFAAVAACLIAAAVMADETISADVTLSADADWRAKGMVTIAEGVTVSLNGHNLSLAGLAGVGTIDSPIADLTSPSGASSSPTTFLGGNAGNLFNNNFARNGTDNTRRIIVAKANLPLIVDYDFGAGNEKTIDMYNVYCGPMQNYQKRCPKSWTFEGSNDNQNWTVLDTRSSETGWSANNADCRTKTFENTTAYRYYRFKATAAQDNTDGYLEMVQLEYFDTSACDELHLDIPAETTVENEGVAIKGNIKLVKEGAGTFMAAKSGQSYVGGTHIVAGTFKGGSTYNVSGYAGTGPILVESGATLDINGNLYFYQNPITLAGGTVANTGTSPTINQTQLAVLKLTADSYFNAQGSLGMINAGHSESRIDLGGHTLFVTIGESVFRLDNTDVVNGTIKVVENHGIISFVNREVRSQNATFDFTGKLSCYVDSKVGDMILREEEFSAPGAPNLFSVFGKLTPLSDDFSNMEMQDGSTIDLSARTKSLNTANPTDEYHITFVSNAVVTLNLEGRTLALGEKLISWRKKWRPAEVTFQFDVPTAQSGIEPVLTDTGLFYGVDPNSTLAEYAWWTGAANDGNPANPANWTCKNAAGNIIENGLPGAITTVSVTGATDFQAPADSSFVCEVFEIGDCRLTADCDWRAVARFMLDAESKIDLNGHKLYVNGLYGDGEVTGGEFDLTTDDSSRVSSPTTFYSNTKAANLFNNNFTRGGTDSNRRIIVANASLPLVVDYDFGEATYVDEYALYVGPDYGNRTPRRWNVYGSDDGSSWTLLDSRTVLDIGDSALCRRYRIAAPAAYRRYRYESTEAIAPADGFFEMVQIEYGDSRTTGELHVNVPEGETANNANVLLTGKLKFVKEGAGTFIATKSGQTYCGGTEIVAGLFQDGTYGFNAPLGNAGAITIGPEGRFDMRNGAFFGYPFVLAGGVVSSKDFPGTGRTISSLTLTADSLFDATHTFGLVADTKNKENHPSALDLGGHTMDVIIGGGGKAFRLKNTYATNGTIRVTQCAEGGIFSFIDTAVRAETVDFEIKGEVRVHCPTTVRNLTFDESVSTATEAVQSMRSVVYVLGTFKTETTDFPNVRMMDGSVLDLRDGQGAFAAEGTSEADSGLSFADGATVMLDLRGRRFVNGDYAITWQTPPENLASLKFKAYGRSPYTFSTDAGGVRVFSGMVISVR